MGLSASTAAFAIPSFQPRIRDNEAQLGLQGSSYLTKAGGATNAEERAGNVGAIVGIRSTSNPDSIFQSAVEAEGLYGLKRQNYRYLDVGEAYIGLKYKKSAFFLGRKRFTWNNLDSYWTLGLYQPRFRWDYLDERENGLFGLFVNLEPNPNFSFTAYISPIFVPETGAPFEISNGNCKTASTWFACPASSIMVFNQNTNIRFNVDTPPVRKLINHTGGGATMRLGREEKIFARLSYTNKPMNQLMLAYEGRLDLSTLEIPAIIHPRVLRHELYGGDLGGKIKHMSLVGSLIHERTKRDYTPANWNTQEVSDAWISGLTVKSPLFWNPEGKTNLEFSYLRRKGGNEFDKGPFVSTATAVMEPRYPFSEAYSVSVMTPIFDAWADQFRFATKFIWDNAYEGNILVADMHYRPSPRWLLNVGVDLLGSKSPQIFDFISRYQRNDRVRGGVRYVF